MDTSLAHMPVIQRLGNMGMDGSVCHINGQPWRRETTMEPIHPTEYHKAIRGKETGIETWDPMSGYAQ